MSQNIEKKDMPFAFKILRDSLLSCNFHFSHKLYKEEGKQKIEGGRKEIEEWTV